MLQDLPSLRLSHHLLFDMISLLVVLVSVDFLCWIAKYYIGEAPHTTAHTVKH